MTELRHIQDPSVRNLSEYVVSLPNLRFKINYKRRSCNRFMENFCRKHEVMGKVSWSCILNAWCKYIRINQKVIPLSLEVVV